MRNTHPSGPPAVVASLMLLVIGYIGSYFALVSRHERPDGIDVVEYPLPIWGYFVYQPAHELDARIRPEYWQSELKFTLLPRTAYFGREHHLGGSKFQTFEVLLARRYARR